MVFAADAPVAWSLVDRARVSRRFVVCDLVTTFTTNANSLLSSLKVRLSRLKALGGASPLEQVRSLSRKHVAVQ